MPPKLALLVGILFVYHAFKRDSRQGIKFWDSLFWPTLWYTIAATRPLGIWIQIWGIPMPLSGGDAMDGSVIDRAFWGALTIIGLVVLSRRHFNWGEAFRRNQWFALLLLYMAVSILWSDYGLVSFKRYVKVAGALVMACIILSEPDPFHAFRTVIRRCLYIHLPMSIICTRYFREIGVSFDWSGSTEAWQGAATSKNTLGQIAMLGVVYFFWEVRRRWPELRWKNFHTIYLLMALYLLKGAESISMTSVSVCVLALSIFLRLQSLKRRPEAARAFVWAAFCGISALAIFVVIHGIVFFSEDSIFGKIITTLGRDITMTDRTNIWHDVYAAVHNPILGVGFGGFWIGRTANIPWNAHMTWVLGQGHSGYVDTFLQLGAIGWMLLAAVLVSSLNNIVKTLQDDFDFACFRITLFITIIFVNITESTYLRGDHHMWLLFQLVAWSVPRSRPQTAPLPGDPPPVSSPAYI